MSRDQQAYRQFIEDAGDMLNEHGMPHMAGRVIGSLLVCDPPHRSLDELAEDLSASRGSISMATQLLLRIGVIDKLSLPGERRHYYRVRPEVWLQQLAQKEEHIARHFRVLTEGLALLEGQPIEKKRRLLELLIFFDFLAEEVPGYVERWERRKDELMRKRMEEFA